MTQPEALRLAEELDIRQVEQKAAAELRRLHEENQALCQALAQPEQEPVEVFWSANKQICFRVGVQSFRLDHFVDTQDEFELMKRLLLRAFERAAPPKREWQGLTDEEVMKIIGVSSADSDWNTVTVHKWIREIEAKLKEKNV